MSHTKPHSWCKDNLDWREQKVCHKVANQLTSYRRGEKSLPFSKTIFPQDQEKLINQINNLNSSANYTSCIISPPRLEGLFVMQYASHIIQQFIQFRV